MLAVLGPLRTPRKLAKVSRLGPLGEAQVLVRFVFYAVCGLAAVWAGWYYAKNRQRIRKLFRAPGGGEESKPLAPAPASADLVRDFRI